jgi:DUF1707 SHOCT-like domain/Cell wall-active antibiotics response LiaF, C-terminal
MSGEVEPRASDAEREQAVARLREASAEGRLTFEELADRAALAYRAQSHAELVRLTEDLPPAPSSRRKVARWMGVVVGEVKRTGRWRVASHTNVVMGIGSCELDLRSAELDGGEVTVTVWQVVGDTTIVVPQHVDVEAGGLFLVGSKSVAGSEEDLAPSAPRVRVRAFGVIGDLKLVRR